MSKYQFIIANNEDNRRGLVYLAITQEIETLAMSDTYDSYGQSVSGYEAGNSKTILSQKAADFLNSQMLEEFDEVTTHAVGDTLIDDCTEYDLLNNLTEGEDYECNKPTLKGFNYWDGSNWATVSVDADFGDTSHTLIEDEELIANLNKAIEESEFVKEGFGTSTYKTDEYVIVQSHFADHFESYTIFPISEHEFLNEEL